MNESPKLVHIIDDESEICELYEFFLSHEPINGKELKIEKSFNGMDGLEKIQSQNQKSDIVILDLKMPKMNGSEVYAEIAKEQELKNTKTIIVSANIEDHPVCQSENVYFLEKPVAVKRLRRMVSMLSRN